MSDLATLPTGSGDARPRGLAALRERLSGALTPAASAAGDGRKNPWLDLVRSVAILLVLLRHGQRALSGGADGAGVLETFFMNGWVGVDLFFVLSGYLIARHLIGAGIGEGRLAMGRYLALRALRIVPAYLAVLALILVGAFPFYAIGEQALPLRVGYHLLFLQDYLPSNINVVFWSLGVEEKFYLLAPLVLLALLRLRSNAMRAALLLVLFAVPVVSRAWIFLRLPEAIGYETFFHLLRTPFHLSLEGLVVGVAIAIAQYAGVVRPSQAAGLSFLSLGLIATVALLASHELMAVIGVFDAMAQPALIALLAGVTTLGAVQLAGVRMPFAAAAGVVSRLSYCLYLVHYPLIPLATVGAMASGGWAFWPVYLAVSFTAAGLLHVAVEQPFLTLKDRLAERGRADRTVEAVRA